MVIISIFITSNLYSIPFWYSDVETFIIKHESYRKDTYECLGGMLTNGFGTKAKYPNEQINITVATYRMREYLVTITFKKFAKYKLKMSKNRKIGLSSFDYNTDKLKKILYKDKNGNYQVNCKRMLKFNTVKGVYNEVLDKRRKEEYELCKN